MCIHCVKHQHVHTLASQLRGFLLGRALLPNLPHIIHTLLTRQSVRNMLTGTLSGGTSLVAMCSSMGWMSGWVMKPSWSASHLEKMRGSASSYTCKWHVKQVDARVEGLGRRR